MSPDDYDLKAARALASARLLQDSGDTEGACNRAYYAMFDAAHAALLRSGAHVNSSETKTHRGLIGAFGKYLVKSGLMAPELGRSLNAVENTRLLADYSGNEISSDEASWVVEQAASFLDKLTEVLLEKATLAIDPEASFQPANPAAPNIGHVVVSTAMHCVQNVGLHSYMIHALNCPVSEKVIDIHYANGKPVLTSHGNEASRGRVD